MEWQSSCFPLIFSLSLCPCLSAASWIALLFQPMNSSVLKLPDLNSGLEHTTWHNRGGTRVNPSRHHCAVKWRRPTYLATPTSPLLPSSSYSRRYGIEQLESKPYIYVLKTLLQYYYAVIILISFMCFFLNLIHVYFPRFWFLWLLSITKFVFTSVLL